MDSVVKTYRTKEQFKALQWDGHSARPMFDFLTQTTDESIRTEGEHFWIDIDGGTRRAGDLYLKTRLGDEAVHVGDYVVRTESGTYLSLSPQLFESAYEEADSEE